jgi:hypothetical protein
MRTAVPLALLWFTLSLSGRAQQVGYRDLTTSWRAPEDHIPSPSSTTCPTVKSTISDGAIVKGVQIQSAVSERRDKIEFIIQEIAPLKPSVGGQFSALVRLKNIGESRILIPWQPNGEQVTRVSDDGTEENYEVADVSFRLATGGKKSIAVPLRSEGALFAQPGDAAAYLRLDSGGWVDIKVKVAVVCGLEDCRSDIKPDDHGVLTASWYQRVLTHHVKDCNENHGAYTVRELDSAVFPVVVRPAVTPSLPSTNR